MLELTTLETFEIKGRGTAHVVAVPLGEYAYGWRGQTVQLDGRAVQIIGVEVFATNPPTTGPTTPILVRDLPVDD